MKKIVFISDFFLNDVVGGGELNDHELTQLIAERNTIVKMQSHLVTVDFLKQHKECFFIISNFVNLNYVCRKYLFDLEYIIYEHDHKYLKDRNPAKYRNFKADTSDIVNYHFYKNAKKVICQSNFHKDIMKKNLNLDNIISVSGNIWSKSVLDKLRVLSQNEKKDACSILHSNIWHKNTHGAIEYCNKKNLEYDLIQSQDYETFLTLLSTNDKFIFLPKTPETLSRVVVEARMLGCKVITNSLVGASKEPWFHLKGLELVDYMDNKRDEIVTIIENIINDPFSQTERPLISVVATFYEGEKFLEGLLQDITSQTIFDRCELILVDTASPGKEKEIVNKYLEKYNNILYYRYDERYNPTVGTNIALQKANSNYVTIANIDDRRDVTFLEESYNCIENNSEAKLVYSDCYITSKPNEQFQKNKNYEGLMEHSVPLFSKENMIKCLPGPMPFWDIEINEKCGFFSEKYKYANDWEMWLRAVNNGFVFVKNEKPLGLYLSGGRSQSEDPEQRVEEAQIFYKYSNVFGQNFYNYKPYFDQFMRNEK